MLACCGGTCDKPPVAALTLLNPPDPNPVRKTLGVAADDRFVLVGDHAGAAIPAALGDLGLSVADRARHIAVDIGTQALGDALAERLGAPFVSQAYSRLVVDCNRDPAHPESIVTESDGTAVPGNAGLRDAQRGMRRTIIFEPYHRAIERLIDMCMHECVIVSLHSFTPVLAGKARPWDIGVLHDGHRDDFALAMLAVLRAAPGLTIGDNEPYRMDATDYTVPRHAFARNLRYVELEVRQDRLREPGEVDELADVIAAALRCAAAKTEGETSCR